MLYLIPVCGALALLFAWVRTRWILRQDSGTERMVEISAYIRAGRDGVPAARSTGCWRSSWWWWRRCWRGPAPWSRAARSLIGLSVAVGAFCSALAGFFGMRVATRANVRTTAAARTSLNSALRVAFSGGAVMGFCVVGLGVLGLAPALPALRAGLRRSGDQPTTR